MDGKNHKDVNQWQNQKPFIAVRYVDMKAANGTDSVLPVKLGIVWKKMCRFLLLQKLAVGSGSECQSGRPHSDYPAGGLRIHAVRTDIFPLHRDPGRYQTGIGELDRVLGGGLVKGSIVLLGGEPGIGKSTLLLQICQFLGESYSVLYVSGEESTKQIKLRAVRLGVCTENGCTEHLRYHCCL